MITLQGEQVPLDGDGAPSLYTIGASLGRIVRFCGHTKLWYPVLGHTLTVAAIMPPEFGIYGLGHDTPEVCVSDVPTPWKTQVARNREWRLLKRIYQAHAPELWPIPEEAQEQVDLADHKALVAEAYVLEHPGYGTIWTETPDQDAVELTLFHQEKFLQFMEPEIAGPIFEEAWKTYTEKRRRSVAAKAAHAARLAGATK
jgi:hypothetical protein